MRVSGQIVVFLSLRIPTCAIGQVEETICRCPCSDELTTTTTFENPRRRKECRFIIIIDLNESIKKDRIISNRYFLIS